ncbi:AAA family ATPase [Anaerobium acetethylicum]|uniref:Nuclease SbcCD subunit C n=1 Tax=Anaerobium acetethylicum TaxID=1619234 RepID=A0A1D3TUM3_9FIRM|nr:AAA family ATPase [Anaerobium acetethylicum]SCP97770.1 DNA sulfur modification protein DndD [Anaerobium acetethylicum]
MIINKLEMYNFRQYIGYQKIEFSTDPDKNVTVLIGVNTSGKTTIVRAFEWCLYGKNGFEDPILLNSDIRDNMQVGDIQDVWVAVTFTHDEKVYTIKKIFKYLCNERISDGGKWNVTLNKKPEEILSLEYLQSDGQTKTPIDQSNISESMDRVLPKDLADYFFFGGERISGIANRTDLSKAVRGLMRLDVLENASTHLSKVVKSFENSIDTSGDANAQKAKDSLGTYMKKREQVVDEKNNAEKQMEYWKSKEAEFNAQLAKSNIDQVKQAKKERDRIESTLCSEKSKLERAKKDMVNYFSDPKFRAFAYFGMPAINEVLRSLDLLKGTKQNVECVPDMEQGAIDFLVKRGHCICGTKLDKGTIPYEKVMEERRILPPEVLSSAVQTYKSKAEGYLAGTEDYKSNMEEKYKDIRHIVRRIGGLTDDLEKQSELILDDTDAKKIEADRKDAHTKYIEAKQDYDSLVASIGGCDTNIKNCEMAIDKYAKSSTKNTRVARFISYSQKVYDWLLETYKGKEEIVREQLQIRVNDNFKKMYHGERSIVIDDKYRVKYSDITTEESDGLKAVKSFAFIASLVSMAKDKILDDADMKLGQVYPLVMDAPFSNVDEIHIDNICKILPQTANQVIMAIMQKDWEYASNNLNQHVGKSYKIEKDKDADGKEIDTSTHFR